jgi:photosystem II stability/assembly factor-like uncharacterized protein
VLTKKTFKIHKERKAAEMKKAIFYLIIICFMVDFANAQSGNWNRLETGILAHWFSVYFTDINTGYLAGYAPGGGVIAKTTNAGNNWTEVYLDTENFFRSICFTDLNTGFASGRRVGSSDSGIIIRTTNGGINWVQTRTKQIIALSFPAANTGYGVGGSSALVMKTTDNGISWVPNESFGTSFALGVYFLNVNTGWVVGNGGLISKTTNAGANWTYEQSNFYESINGIYFKDANTGIAVGGSTSNNYSGILRTTNGGENWDTIPKPFPYSQCDLWSVRFISANTGFITGWCGEVYRTVDGGSSWCKQDSATGEILEWSAFTNLNTGYVVGYYNTVLKTTNGGGPCIITGLNKNMNEIPGNYALHQNFPNPFNPATVIRYEIPEQSYVKLTVYNVIGKEIVTLVNEVKQAGNYEAVFDGTDLPSGVYFYTLKSGEFKETKKMILMK